MIPFQVSIRGHPPTLYPGHLMNPRRCVDIETKAAPLEQATEEDFVSILMKQADGHHQTIYYPTNHCPKLYIELATQILKT